MVLRRVGVTLAALLLGLIAALVVPAPGAVADPAPAAPQRVTIASVPEPGSTTATRLDAAVYRPATAGRPAPAVILAHGFGGDWQSMASTAGTLVDAGFVVISYTARGFGASTGRVHLDDPAYEITDLRKVIDYTAALPGVQLDKPGDPRVALLGVSYGGAAVLMAAAADHRVDAVVPIDTWNDLGAAFFPNALGGRQPHDTPTGSLAVDRADTMAGPFKQQWLSRFFGTVAGQPTDSGVPATCGRMDPAVCADFLDASRTGRPSAALITVLDRHSPRTTLAGVRAPALIMQGVSDSLFGLDQADATAVALAERQVPVTIRWITAGHDGGQIDLGALSGTVVSWLNHQLRPAAGDPAIPQFGYPGPPDATGRITQYVLPDYPGLGSNPPLTEDRVTLHGRQTWIASPPGGQPASTIAIPGLPTGGGSAGSASSGPALSTYPLAALPGQSVAFDSDPLPTEVRVLGAPTVTLGVARPTSGSAQFFVSLWQVGGVDADGSATLPRALVAPVRLPVGPSRQPVPIVLPPSTYDFPAGTVLRVLVTTTDSTFANPTSPSFLQVGLSEAELTLPIGQGTAATPSGPAALRSDPESLWLGVALLATLAGAVAWGLVWRRRSRALPRRADLADVPLAVEGLIKAYSDGHKAVDGVSLRAERGQVVGLLGPNGAGKTTTMRMLMGLIRPDAGTVHVLGRPVTAGASVLRTVGALVEGPGFLPHLSGRANLRAYWAATGRPAAEAGFDEALEVAALGGAIDRPVRSYSQGMRQRLGIAQAMLGRPDLLILDEPTNGLDPPQIAAMRPVLRAYAESGRTVLISSYLISEVELSCTHVVMMSAGRVITAGPVAELVADDASTRVEFADGVDVEAVAGRVADLPGIDEVRVDDDRTMIITGSRPRSELITAVLAAEPRVTTVSAHRHLEEVFLGVIAGAQPPAGRSEPGSLVDRLRQIRPR